MIARANGFYNVMFLLSLVLRSDLRVDVAAEYKQRDERTDAARKRRHVTVRPSHRDGVRFLRRA